MQLHATDQTTITLRLGRWSENFAPDEESKAVELAFSREYDPPNNFEETLRGWGWRPWAHEVRYSAYYANAAGDTLSLLFNIWPTLAPALLNGSLEAIAQYFLTSLLDFFGREGTPPVTLEAATERAEWALTHHGGVALRDVRTISVEPNDDGGFTFIYRDERESYDHLVRVSAAGLAAYANLSEFQRYKERAALWNSQSPTS